MSVTDYQRIRDSADEILPELERLLGTSILPAAANSSADDLFVLLRLILGHVYFDVFDAWLLAEALIEQVTSLLTTDDYFKQTTNRIHNPGGAQDDDERILWTEVRSAIQQMMASILLLAPEEQDLVVIPQAVTPRTSE